MITDFVKIENATEDLIKEYEGKLPVEVIDIWREYGLGTFYNDYLKVVNPNDYQELLDNF